MRLSVKYIKNLDLDIGEEIHIRGVVKPECGQDIQFQIRAARWELHQEKNYGEQTMLEAEGNLTIDGHTLDALIKPQKTGRYRLKFIYQIADETWIDVIRLRVN